MSVVRADTGTPIDPFSGGCVTAIVASNGHEHSRPAAGQLSRSCS
jgi:hypothetical protein